jgi:hypothetical protein
VWHPSPPRAAPGLPCGRTVPSTGRHTGPSVQDCRQPAIMSMSLGRAETNDRDLRQGPVGELTTAVTTNADDRPAPAAPSESGRGADRKLGRWVARFWRSSGLPRWSSRKAPGWYRVTAVLTATSSTVPHSNTSRRTHFPANAGCARRAVRSGTCIHLLIAGLLVRVGAQLGVVAGVAQHTPRRAAAKTRDMAGTDRPLGAEAGRAGDLPSRAGFTENG